VKKSDPGNSTSKEEEDLKEPKGVNNEGLDPSSTPPSNPSDPQGSSKDSPGKGSKKSSAKEKKKPVDRMEVFASSRACSESYVIKECSLMFSYYLSTLPDFIGSGE